MESAGVLLPMWSEHDDTRYQVRQTLRLWEFREHGTVDPRECIPDLFDPEDAPTRFDPEEAGMVRVA